MTIGSLGASTCTRCVQPASMRRTSSAGIALPAKALHLPADGLGNPVIGEAGAQDRGERAFEAEIELDRMAAEEAGIGAGDVQPGIHLAVRSEARGAGDPRR